MLLFLLIIMQKLPLNILVQNSEILPQPKFALLYIINKLSDNFGWGWTKKLTIIYELPFENTPEPSRYFCVWTRDIEEQIDIWTTNNRNIESDQLNCLQSEIFHSLSSLNTWLTNPKHTHKDTYSNALKPIRREKKTSAAQSSLIAIKESIKSEIKT